MMANTPDLGSRDDAAHGEEPGYTLYQRGKRHLADGSLPEALAELEQSCALAPHHKTFGLLGEAYEAAGDTNQAIRCYCTAVLLGRDARAFKRAEALLAARGVSDFGDTVRRLWG